MTLITVTIYLLLINVVLFVLIGIDKKRAKRKAYRISERTLLLLGLFGAGFGGLIGMMTFNHKVNKALFYWINLVGAGVSFALIQWLLHQ